MTPKTSAKVPPRPLKSRLVASAPVPAAAPDNLSKPSDDLQDMNFKVSPAFHRAFKITAVTRGMSMKELLEAAFRTWQERYENGSPRKADPAPPADLFRGDGGTTRDR